jgi:hypothetical protein
MTSDLKKLLSDLQSDESLFDPSQLGRRIEALDMLDAAHAFDSDDVATLNPALGMQNRLEKANTAIYGSIRQEIRQTGKPDGLLRWINRVREPGEAAPGLGYDVLDELIAGVLPIPQPGEVEGTSAEQVFYQPTPVRHVLELIQRSRLSPDDVLFDFGSGLGQLCIVASILTGARAIGIEIEAAYLESARQCAQDLALEDRVSFVGGDARQADLSAGTVFHLYTPFTGSILRIVLDRLREQAGNRPIRISTLGPCTEVVARENWLRPQIPPSTDRLTVFHAEL